MLDKSKDNWWYLIVLAFIHLLVLDLQVEVNVLQANECLACLSKFLFWKVFHIFVILHDIVTMHPFFGDFFFTKVWCNF